MRILIKEFFKDDYISRVAGEKLRLLILNSIQKKERLELDFRDLVIASTSFFDEGVAKLNEEKISVEDFLEFVHFKNLNKNDEKVLHKVSEFRGFIFNSSVIHPWRICPMGEHWVKEHPRVSKNGVKTSVEAHCRKSPKGKDVIYPEEIIHIAQTHFSNLKDLPSEKSLGFPNGNTFNLIIAGWCTYWNEVLKPKHKLDPNIVKILIATESGFSPEPSVSKTHKAIGLMQIMPQTIKYLSSKEKELQDHFIEIDEESVRDPVVNIAAGTRWLFRKFELTERKLKRVPTWKEVLFDYKGITNDDSKDAIKIRASIDKYLKELKL